MKHKVNVNVEVEKQGIFGKKKIIEERTVYLDDKQYREYKKAEKKRGQAWRDRPYSIEEMMFFDDIFGD